MRVRIQCQYNNVCTRCHGFDSKPSIIWNFITPPPSVYMTLTRLCIETKHSLRGDRQALDRARCVVAQLQRGGLRDQDDQGGCFTYGHGRGPACAGELRPGGFILLVAETRQNDTLNQPLPGNTHRRERGDCREAERHAAGGEGGQRTI